MVYGLEPSPGNEKPETKVANQSAPRSIRGRSTAMVSKSMGVINLLADEKYAMLPLRRMSIPAKSALNSSSWSVVSVTPISEAGSRRSAKSETLIGELARSTARQKAPLSSTTYWLSQIKISESATKHPVSLGFFKLTVKAEFKPAHKMQEELKLYVKRHDLARSGSVDVRGVVRELQHLGALEEVTYCRAFFICNRPSTDEDKQELFFHG